MSNEITAVIAVSDKPSSDILRDFVEYFDYKVIFKTNYGYDFVSEVLNNNPTVAFVDSFLFDIDAGRAITLIKESNPEISTVFVVVSTLRDGIGVSKNFAEFADVFTLLPADFYNLHNSVLQAVNQKQSSNWAARTHIENLLVSLGFNPAKLGFGYITDALCLTLRDKTLLSNLTAGLYPKIASINCTTTDAVSRAIRTAISSAKNLDSLGFKSKNFSPGELISILYEKLK